MTCLQLINAVLRGIQLIEEDPDTGQPVVVSAENRAIHLRNIRGVLGAVWANLLAVAQLWTTDERVCQVGSESFMCIVS